MSQQELKACPFCGGEAFVSSAKPDGEFSGPVYCTGCQARTLTRKQWNQRSPSPDQEARLRLALTIIYERVKFWDETEYVKLAAAALNGTHHPALAPPSQEG